MKITLWLGAGSPQHEELKASERVGTAGVEEVRLETQVGASSFRKSGAVRAGISSGHSSFLPL